MTTEQRLQQIVDRLASMKPVRILLFGSSARGEADRWSDLDLIVVAEQVPARFLDRIAQAFDLIDPRYALDILVYTPDEYGQMLDDGNPFIETAKRQGRELYVRSAA